MKSPTQQQKSEHDNTSSINSYEDLNTVQNKSSFKNKADLLDKTSSPSIFKRMKTIDPEANTPMSQETK